MHHSELLLQLVLLEATQHLVNNSESDPIFSSGQSSMILNTLLAIELIGVGFHGTALSAFLWSARLCDVKLTAFDLEKRSKIEPHRSF